MTVWGGISVVPPGHKDQPFLGKVTGRINARKSGGGGLLKLDHLGGWKPFPEWQPELVTPQHLTQRMHAHI